MSTFKLEQEITNISKYLADKYGVVDVDGSIRVDVPDEEPISSRIFSLSRELDSRRTGL